MREQTSFFYHPDKQALEQKLKSFKRKEQVAFLLQAAIVEPMFFLDAITLGNFIVSAAHAKALMPPPDLLWSAAAFTLLFAMLALMEKYFAKSGEKIGIELSNFNKNGIEISSLSGG